MGKEISAATFDYSDFEPDAKGKLISLAGQIKRAHATFNRSLFDVGEVLAHAHSVLAKHKEGTFKKWIESEAGIESSTAYNYMYAWMRFHGFPNRDLISAGAMYKLAAPSAPPAAAKEAEKIASKGERVTEPIAAGLIKKHKGGGNCPTLDNSKAKTGKSVTATSAPTSSHLNTSQRAEKTKEEEPENPAEVELPSPMSNDPIGDSCKHEWDDNGDCVKCKIPRHEVEPAAKQFKALLEHVRLALQLVDSVSTALGGSPSKRCRDHEYAMAGLDSAHEVIKKWKRKAKC